MDVKRRIRGLWHFLWGNLFALCFYDQKYLRGRWFSGKRTGICAPGWEWVTRDALGRIFTRNNPDVPFPVSSQIRVVNPKNLVFDPDDLNNFQTYGNYFQAIGRIEIGSGTYIAPNVGLITANHDPADLDAHLPPREIIIGKKCWIGMNSVLLPGVVLGEGTVVGAGSVVTRSFPEGHCVIAGSPAKILRHLQSGG